MEKIWLLALLLILLISLVGSVLAFDVNQNITATILPGTIDVYSPVQDAIYDYRMILINLSMSAEVKYFKFSDNGDRLRTLCRKCSSYSKRKAFDEGFHELTIFGMFDAGDVTERINFTVDTKKPKIIKTNPTRGFATGLFEVEFEEENPISLFLNYGNNVAGYRSDELNINECSIKKGKHYCNESVNLQDYDLQEIEYNFNITDIIGKFDKSKTKKVNVDVSAPIINSFNYTQEKRYIIFTLNITELNFEEINYIDFNETRLRWRTLCSKLKDGLCKKRKYFRKGEHNVTIEILDKAGNSVSINRNFTVT